jgi:hypothetical protein
MKYQRYAVEMNVKNAMLPFKTGAKCIGSGWTDASGTYQIVQPTVVMEMPNNWLTLSIKINL